MSLKNELQFMLDTYAEDYRARDLEACLAFFDENCRFITPRGVLDGKSQVEKLHQFWVSEHRVEREMQVQQIERMGDHVYAIWRFRDLIVDPASQESTVQKGTALGVIRLDPDDGWLIVACSSNADMDAFRYPTDLKQPKSAA
ncbi:nuclear transport factor 2 family protein [Tropicimonas sp. TH_r6]|uniref:YybH family protein n=1 Tax=Tropicimonas sp. TH_r6 TaxID=3082085 RepID=UPI0029533790|nr:nuclear transport factor 2 family protein [Tropicimonas sp. TH_r6]MDV7141071.1 nuclear transport factor 2 family protein [Tropicimonas sp. TH_r6]